MIRITVIIPYFQRKPGILRRALLSVARQQPAASVDIIVVDDGSPAPAAAEAEGIHFAWGTSLRIVEQVNKGVAAARNTGLRAVTPQTDYIAFLDSDDTWRSGHLDRAATALEQGYDFYFCDNRREGQHESHFHSSDKNTLSGYIPVSCGEDDIVPLGINTLCTLILKEFPTQASTTLYRRSIAPDLLFEETLSNAGEDSMFFLALASKARYACFSPEIMVDCGKGINIYWSNTDWNSPRHFKRVIDRLRAHMLIERTIQLTKEGRFWNNRVIDCLRRNMAFHAVRRMVKDRGAVPADLKRFVAWDRWFACWFPLYAVQAVVGKALRLYKPE